MQFPRVPTPNRPQPIIASGGASAEAAPSVQPGFSATDLGPTSGSSAPATGAAGPVADLQRTFRGLDEPTAIPAGDFDGKIIAFNDSKALWAAADLGWKGVRFEGGEAEITMPWFLKPVSLFRNFLVGRDQGPTSIQRSAYDNRDVVRIDLPTPGIPRWFELRPMKDGSWMGIVSPTDRGPGADGRHIVKLTPS